MTYTFILLWQSLRYIFRVARVSKTTFVRRQGDLATSRLYSTVPPTFPPKAGDGQVFEVVVKERLLLWSGERGFNFFVKVQLYVEGTYTSRIT